MSFQEAITMSMYYNEGFYVSLSGWVPAWFG